MQLVEPGGSGWTSRSGRSCPSWPACRCWTGSATDGQPLLRPARREVTLHDLLTHTSGFVYEMWNADLGRYVRATGQAGLRQRAECRAGDAARLRSRRAVGIRHRRRLGRQGGGGGQRPDARRYFAEHIFRPARHDGHAVRPARQRPRRHAPQPPAGRLAARRQLRPAVQARAGERRRRAVLDRARLPAFLAMLLRGGDGVLRPETVASMGATRSARWT